MVGNCDLRESKAQVVAIGSFNPLIFQPHWLAQAGLIGDAELAAADEGNGIELMHREAVIITLQRLRLTVLPERFMIESVEPPLVGVKDFAEKCFGLLSHTPIKQIGLNFETVFRARTREDWDALGDALAPKQPWQALLGDERSGGLVQQTMERGKRFDALQGKITVVVKALEPREKMDTSVMVNNHVDLPENSTGDTLVQHLQAYWDTDHARSEQITNALQELTRAR